MGPELREARAGGGSEAEWVVPSQAFSPWLSGAREQAWLERWGVGWARGANSPGGILKPKKDRSGGHRLQPPPSGWMFLGGMPRLI